MCVDVLAEVLAPSVQHQRDAGLCSEVLGIGGEGLEGIGGGMEQQSIEYRRVALSQRVEFVWQREDGVEIRHRQ